MALHDPKCRPWWRRIDIAEVRRDVALMTEGDELLYFRFLLAYAEHRCTLPADARVLAKVLNTSEKRAAGFMKAAAHCLSVDDAGMIRHANSEDDFNRALAESRRQANRRLRGVSNA